MIAATTEPLANGAALPDYPSSTTSLKIIKYGKVYDAEDGRPLTPGTLHNSAVSMLMGNQIGGLGHLYCFAIRDKKIYHTRKKVVIDVECVDAD